MVRFHRHPCLIWAAAMLFLLGMCSLMVSTNGDRVERSRSSAVPTTAYLYYNYSNGIWHPTTARTLGTDLIGPGCGVSSSVPSNATSDSDLWWREGGCTGVVAEAVFVPSLQSTGWDELTVRTSGRFDDKTQAFASGYIEGYLTHERIFSMVDVAVRRKPVDHRFINYLTQHDAYLRAKVKANAPTIFRYGPEDTTPTTTTAPTAPTRKQAYWYQIGLILAQFDGLLQGYNERANAKSQITALELWQINADGDKMDIDRAVAVTGDAATVASANDTSANNGPSISLSSKITNLASAARFQQKSQKFVPEMTKQEVLELIAFNGHCSALIRFTGDDILVGHNTWSDYDMFLRFYKSFDYNFHHPGVKSQAVSFTSYPGYLWSSDDYYQTSRGSSLVLTETTITILDENLYRDHVAPTKGVMTWLRNIAANRMASSGQEWMEVFKHHQSGTYNNQWMIVDMDLLEQAKQGVTVEPTASTNTVIAAVTDLVKTAKRAVRAQQAKKATVAPSATTTNSTSVVTTIKKKATAFKRWVKSTAEGILTPIQVIKAAQRQSQKVGEKRAEKKANKGKLVKKSAKEAAPTLTPVPTSTGLQLLPGTFYIMEQIPGYVESRDLTSLLQDEGYFASYNLPYIQAINEKSMYASYANAFQSESLVYKNCTRGRLFAAQQGSVTDVASMQRLLRSNDYQTPGSLTKGCPAQAISSRYDLPRVPGAICDIMTPRLNGAIDAKVTSSSYMASRRMDLIAGPTTSNGLTPFSWNAPSVPEKTRKQMRSSQTATMFNFAWKSMQPTPIYALQKSKLKRFTKPTQANVQQRRRQRQAQATVQSVPTIPSSIPASPPPQPQPIVTVASEPKLIPAVILANPFNIDS